MYLTLGYVLIAFVLVKLCFLQTFRGNFSQKRWVFLSLGWHALSDFRLNVLRQHALRNASLLYDSYVVTVQEAK